MSVPELPGSLRSLIEVGAALMRRTTSGKVLMARYARVVDDEAVPELVREQVRAELDAAWEAVVEPFGKPPKGADREPLAVTPTAQVWARGDQVVKVARPGLAASVRSELALVDTLAAPMRVVFPALDVRGVMAEAREATMDELDLEHEAETQSRMRRTLRRLDGVVVPSVELDECEPERLVAERLQGEPLETMSVDQAELLVAAHLVAWRDAGLVPTDARPSHLLALDDGSLGLLGLGLARPVSRDRLKPFVDAFVALSDPDPAAFAAAVAELGILPDGTAERAHELLRDVAGSLADAGEVTLDAAAIREVTVRAAERVRELLSLGAGATPEPRDIAAGRMVGQLVATIARYGVTADWPALVTRAASAAS